MAKILDGKAISAEIRAELKTRVSELKDQGIVPGLAVLLVGDDPASRSYVTAKERACEEAGIYSREVKLPATATLDEILKEVRQFNADDQINGILVQPFHQGLGHHGHPCFGVSTGRRVIPVNIAKVPLPVHQRIAHVEILRQARHGVVNRHVAMGVIVAHHVAGNFGTFAKPPGMFQL
jgi:hypothetical protein